MNSFKEAHSAIPNTNAGNKNVPVGSDGIRTHAPEETGAPWTARPRYHRNKIFLPVFLCPIFGHQCEERAQPQSKNQTTRPISHISLKKALNHFTELLLAVFHSSPKTIHVSRIWRNFLDNDIYLHTAFINNICNITVITHRMYHNLSPSSRSWTSDLWITYINAPMLIIPTVHHSTNWAIEGYLLNTFKLSHCGILCEN
jgi:hypothetical protein